MEAYGNDTYRRKDYVMPLEKEPESWRGSSGFDLASLLNRSSSSVAVTSTMPKLNLPSFSRFGKLAAYKPDNVLASQRHEDQSRFVSSRYQHQHRSAESSPARQTSPSHSSCRIAPAPANDVDPEQEAENTAAGVHDRNANHSIRGGRWNVDEHERFLDGFRIHGHKWKRVQQVVRTRSVTQVRTHAQKYLLKVAKLKAEKKHSGKDNDMATLASEPHKRSRSVDGSKSAFLTPELGAAHDSPRKTPLKKVRRLDPGKCNPVDQQYIAAAATTLCFLMSQKIDSLFDSKQESAMDGHKSDYEPYDCYAPQTVKRLNTERIGSRKRPYIHLIANEEESYSLSYETVYGEASSYPIKGSKLFS